MYFEKNLPKLRTIEMLGVKLVDAKVYNITQIMNMINQYWQETSSGLYSVACDVIRTTFGDIGQKIIEADILGNQFGYIPIDPELGGEKALQHGCNRNKSILDHPIYRINPKNNHEVYHSIRGRIPFTNIVLTDNISMFWIFRYRDRWISRKFAGKGVLNNYPLSIWVERLFDDVPHIHLLEVRDMSLESGINDLCVFTPGSISRATARILSYYMVFSIIQNKKRRHEESPVTNKTGRVQINKKKYIPLEYSVVDVKTFKPEEKPTVVKFSTKRQSPLQHEVQGFWRTSKKGNRHWVHSFKRGDPTLGIKETDYRVVN